MANTRDITTDNLHLNILLYGPSGVGKTKFASYFPDPYFFDFDKGMLTLRREEFEYDTYEDVFEGSKCVKSAYNEFKKKMKDPNFNPGTIIVDSVSTLQEYALDEILRLNTRPEPTLHEWGLLVSWLRDLFLTITKSPCNVIVTAHEQLIKDEITGEVLIQPLIVGKKMPNALPLFFDEVYKLRVGRDEKYEFMTKAATKWTAKSRLGTMDKIMDWTDKDPYKMLMDSLKNEKKGGV